MDQQPFHAIPTQKLFQAFQTNPKGLTHHEVKRRQELYGPNEIEKKEKVSALSIFLQQFKEPLPLLLFVAAILSGFVGDLIDSAAILLVIFLGAVLGFIQEFRAERAMEALTKISAPSCRVLRDGEPHVVKASELVPGDVLLLEAGDIVAGDARIIEATSLQIDQASLTGESVPAVKSNKTAHRNATINDQDNMAFAGTVVTYGKGQAVVTATGGATEFGKIAASLRTTQEQKTPLQKKLAVLVKQIGVAVILLVAFVFILGLFKGTTSIPVLLFFALSLTVAAVPNALPVIVTVGLSAGVSELAKKKMLVKRLPAAESLGAVTIICSDKTGTITKNQMTVTSLYVSHREITVTGSGYEPRGEFLEKNRRVDFEDLTVLVKTGAMCNNASLQQEDGVYSIIGDPTEGALVVLAAKKRFLAPSKRIAELPFDSERKMMSVVGSDHMAYVKGAPDVLLHNCTRILVDGKVRKITPTDKKQILERNNHYASQALRVLGLACKTVSSRTTKFTIDSLENDLIFVGLVGMIDPPREGVFEAVRDCHGAGIKVMMITGDYVLTAQAIARQVGIYTDGDTVLTGEQLETINDEQLMRQIDSITIIARALPIQKLRIVDALQKKGHVVAMTGDGVNDAPALKRADLGVAMGITGTEVSKEVAKVTLVDDHFGTIVNGIREGRTIYDKLLKSVKYLLSCNVGEIFAVIFSVLFTPFLPMKPLQLLIMNLLTDSFPALGLGFETHENNVMKRPPRNPHEKPLSGSTIFQIITFGMIMGFATFFIFNKYLPLGLAKAQTVAFTTLVLFEMWAVLSSRSLAPSFRNLNPFSNLWLTGGVTLSVLLQIAIVHVPFLQTLFGTTALTFVEWREILFFSVFGFIVMELSKFALFFKRKAQYPVAVQ